MDSNKLSAELHSLHVRDTATLQRIELLNDRNRRTKIICTMGPAEAQQSVIEKLILAGMNVARFNFSHGDHTTHKQMLDRVRAASKQVNIPVACLLDTKGPEIRTGLLKDGQAISLLAGQQLKFVFPPMYNQDTFQGDNTTILCDYANGMWYYTVCM